MSEIQELSKWMTNEVRDNDIDAMLPRIMASATKTSRGRMPLIMADLMPKCLETLLPGLSKENRVIFVLRMISILIDKGSVRMSDAEREEFIMQVIDQVRTRKPI